MAVRVANTTALAAVPTTTFSTAINHACEVISLNDVFSFVPGGVATPIANKIINATDAGGQWVRMYIPFGPATLATMSADTVLGTIAGGAPGEIPFKATARAIGAAVSPAAARTALGMVDLTSVEMQALAHANQVCAFANPPSVYRAYMNPKTGTLASKWLTEENGGSASITPVTSGADVGAREIATGATASSYFQLYSQEGSFYVQPLISELIGTKWQFECDFKLTTAINNTAEMGIGWNTGAIDYSRPIIGVRGAQSTGTFRCFLATTATGANSTIAVDLNVWHRLRMWSNGTAGTIYFCVDGEAAVSLSGLSSMGVVGPFLRCHNGATAANRAFRTRYAFYHVDGSIPV